MKGLAKIANDYSYDPIFQMVEENRHQKLQALEEAEAMRNPELVKKEERILGRGVGTGMTGGGLLGAAYGAASGARKPLSMLGRGLAGGALGTAGGALIGGLAALPIAAYSNSKEDPEVKKAIRDARADYYGSAQAKSDYIDQQRMLEEYRKNRVEQRANELLGN